MLKHGKTRWLLTTPRICSTDDFNRLRRFKYKEEWPLEQEAEARAEAERVTQETGIKMRACKATRLSW